MFDTTTASGILTEAFFIQFPFWFLFFTFFRKWMVTNFEGRDWYEAIGRQKGGKSEWLLFATAFPQHSLAGLCLALTKLTGNTSWFVHGIISEWAYESIDIVNQTRLYLGGAFDDNEDGQKAFVAMMCHHIPGMITILPATIYFQDFEEYRDVVWSLLGLAWVMLIGFCGGKTYNLTDLAERTRYTVLFTANFAVAIYTRLFLFPSSMYVMAREHWSNVSWGFVALGILYGVLMMGFNLIMIGVNCERLFKLSFGSEKESAAVARKLQRQSSNFMRFSFDILNDSEDDDEEEGGAKLSRSKSTPVSTFGDYKRKEM